MRYGETNLVYKPSNIYKKFTYVPSGVFQRQFPKQRIGQTVLIDPVVPVSTNPIISGTVPSPVLTNVQLGPYLGITALQEPVSTGVTPLVYSVPIGQTWRILSFTVTLATSSVVQPRQIYFSISYPEFPGQQGTVLGYSFRTVLTPAIQFSQTRIIQGIIGYPVPMDSCFDDFSTIRLFLPDVKMPSSSTIAANISKMDSGDSVDSTIFSIPTLTYEAWGTT